MEGLPQGPGARPALLGSVKGCGGEATHPLTNIPKAPIPRAVLPVPAALPFILDGPSYRRGDSGIQGQARGCSCDRWSSGSAFSRGLPRAPLLLCWVLELSWGTLPSPIIPVSSGCLLQAMPTLEAAKPEVMPLLCTALQPARFLLTAVPPVGQMAKPRAARGVWLGESTELCPPSPGRRP